MKKMFFVIIVALFYYNVNSQIRENIPVKDFNSFKLEGSSTVHLILADSNKLIIEMKDNSVMNYIKIENINKTLFINTTSKNKNIGKTFSKLIFYVYYNNIESIQLDGTGKIITDDTLKVDIFQVELNGSGTLDLTMKCNFFRGNLNGTGSIISKGKAKETNVKINGVGVFKAYKLITQKTNISVDGVGSAYVYATKELDANLHGVGSIKYKGNPQITNIVHTGVGIVKKVD